MPGLKWGGVPVLGHRWAVVRVMLGARTEALLIHSVKKSVADDTIFSRCSRVAVAPELSGAGSGVIHAVGYWPNLRYVTFVVSRGL